MKRCAIFLNSKKLSPTTTNFLSFGSIVTVEMIFLNKIVRQNNLDYSLFRFDKEFTAATKNHVMQTPVLSTVILTPSKVKISWLITYFHINLFQQISQKFIIHFIYSLSRRITFHNSTRARSIVFKKSITIIPSISPLVERRNMDSLKLSSGAS